MASRPKKKRKWKADLKLEAIRKDLKATEKQSVCTRSAYPREAVFTDIHK